MKRIILKKSLSILAVMIAVCGAFASSLKTKYGKDRGPVVGYTLNAQQQCDIAVACDDNPSPFICRLNGTSGPIAYGKNAQGQCVITLWRPF